MKSINSFLRSTIAIATIAVLFTACQKDGAENAELLKIQGQASVLACDTLQYRYTSSTANPRGGTFAPLYLNAATGAYSTSSSLAGATVYLDGNTNSTLKPISGVSAIRYLNTTAAICDLTASDWTIAAPDRSSIGQSTTTSSPYTGYFFYPTPSSPSAVPNFYVLVNDGTDIIAIKYRLITGNIVTPSPLTINGDYDVTVRKIN